MLVPHSSRRHSQSAFPSRRLHIRSTFDISICHVWTVMVLTAPCRWWSWSTQWWWLLDLSLMKNIRAANSQTWLKPHLDFDGSLQERNSNELPRLSERNRKWEFEGWAEVELYSSGTMTALQDWICLLLFSSHNSFYRFSCWAAVDEKTVMFPWIIELFLHSYCIAN